MSFNYYLSVIIKHSFSHPQNGNIKHDKKLFAEQATNKKICCVWIFNFFPSTGNSWGRKISFHDWLTLKIICIQHNFIYLFIYTFHLHHLIWITLGIRRSIKAGIYEKKNSYISLSWIPAGNIILHVNNEMKFISSSREFFSVKLMSMFRQTNCQIFMKLSIIIHNI